MREGLLARRAIVPVAIAASLWGACACARGASTDVRSEVAKYAKVIKDAHIKVE